jgi:hypothetical protein
MEIQSVKKHVLSIQFNIFFARYSRKFNAEANYLPLKTIIITFMEYVYERDNERGFWCNSAYKQDHSNQVLMINEVYNLVCSESEGIKRWYIFTVVHVSITSQFAKYNTIT